MKSVERQFPALRDFFQFEEFNPIQKQCLHKIMRNDCNMIVSAPTSSGKTALFEMAILKYQHLTSPMCLYLAPIKSLCHQKYTEWSRKFSKKLSVTQVTGDSLQGGIDQFLNCHIAVGTPEKIDFLSRQNLEYLKKIRLLLIDEIHMLNYEERGATLEAIVSRIMSLNSNVRILAVSATIPNIYEVGEWLRCPSQDICVFGEEYRPVKIRTVVNGYPHSGNPFTFERVLNFKLLQTVRSYSEKKGSLIFCPTQKGTQQACEQIIAQMRDRQFIQNDRQLVSLVQSAKQVSNSKLQTMIPQGVAFHNAGLSYQDRNIVERLFLDMKIKVLCTTSTLSMGINLPARLVIIKSTQCYKGSGKGYQEYSRIQIQQMTGRAGRPPFDTQGTVVIMTQKSNYNKYNSKLELQTLESQLFNHMLEHINAQISLGSILSVTDLESYFFNSFCYIRMKQSPKNYGINENVETFIKKNCLKAAEKLAELGIIILNDQRVAPRPLSISISRNAVEIRSIALIKGEIEQIQTSKQFLAILCKCEQIGKYSSKLQERKKLKEINQKNKYPLKEAISTSQRKAYVLIQAQLSQFHIEYWEMRRQANDILLLLKRLNNCVKTLGFDVKHFWLYFWATKYQKYFNVRSWEHGNHQSQLGQNRDLNNKLKNVLPEAIQMDNWLKKDERSKLSKKKFQLFHNGIKMHIQKDISGSVTLTIEALQFMKDKYRGATICVGDHSNHLYHYKYLSENNRVVVVHFSKNSYEEFKIGIIKEGIIGFDQFYKLKGDKMFKFDIESQDLHINGHRRSVQPMKNQRQLSFDKAKSHSLENIKKNQNKHSKIDNLEDQTIQKPKVNRNKKEMNEIRDAEETVPASYKAKPSQLVLPEKYRRRVRISPEREEPFPKKIEKTSQSRYRDLREYNWKPGFQKIPSQSEESKKKNEKKLKFVQSKDKGTELDLSNFLYKKPVESTRFKKTQLNQPKKTEIQRKQEEQEDVFDYFYNLF